MKSSSDNIGNQTRDLPACSAVSQLTATSRVVLFGSYFCRNESLRLNKADSGQLIFYYYVILTAVSVPT